MRHKILCALALLYGLSAVCPAQEIRRAVPVLPANPPILRAIPVQPWPTATPRAIPMPPLAPASVNDTARFLAGLSVGPNSSLGTLTQTPVWQKHAAFFNQAWTKLANAQFAGIRDWENAFLPQAAMPQPLALYFFSGPDFLYANQFYPNASTYLLAGAEPVGPLPDVTHVNSLDATLQGIATALNSVLRFSFFITKDMKSDLQQPELKGVLPLFYIFLARAEKTITDITFLTLDEKGNPRITTPNELKSHNATFGVRIVFSAAQGGPPQTLYYFTTDLSNDGIHSRPGFIRFCAQQGAGSSLLKSASYLMFEPGFSSVRDFLLTHSATLIADDSGIPISAFTRDKWNLRLFGSYSGPIDVFKQYDQPALRALFAQSHAPPLHFGVGYRWRRSETSLIVASHK